MPSYARDEIMSSSEVVRNFGTVLTSVAQHKRAKVAIVRNNKLEAVLLSMDVYERMERTCQTAKQGQREASEEMNSGALLEFLRSNRLSMESRISPDDINKQILEERESWE
jgi:PHD/YefM family antitoxin component YafN of YafNO toxin-antitoxin module